MTDSVSEYYRRNKERLHRLMRHSDPVLSAMAAAIVAVGGDGKEDESSKV